MPGGICTVTVLNDAYHHPLLLTLAGEPYAVAEAAIRSGNASKPLK